MSKDFEQAYKEAAQTEAPDLWDRIEAGLKSKSVPEEKSDIESVPKEAVSFKRYIRRYSGVIAAAVCVAIIIPAITFLKPRFAGYSAADTTEGIAESAAADAGASENMAMPAEAGAEADGPKEAGQGQAVTMDVEISENNDMAMGVAEECADEDAAASVESAADETPSDTTDRAAQKRQKESSMSGQSGENSKLSEKEEETLIKYAVIKVTELKEDFDKEGEDSGILCVAVFQENAPALQEEEQLVIYVPSDVVAPLYEDGVFEVDLEYQSGGEYSFVLQKYHREIK